MSSADISGAGEQGPGRQPSGDQTSQQGFCEDVLPIVLSYQAAPDQLRKLLESLAASVPHTLVVNNDPTPLPPLCGGGYSVIENARNVGVAEGLNIGLRHAQSRGYRYAFLLDQDSVPTPNLIECL